MSWTVYADVWQPNEQHPEPWMHVVAIPPGVPDHQSGLTLIFPEDERAHDADKLTHGRESMLLRIRERYPLTEAEEIVLGAQLAAALKAAYRRLFHA